jgi:hypothetical protein
MRQADKRQRRVPLTVGVATCDYINKREDKPVWPPMC